MNHGIIAPGLFLVYNYIHPIKLLCNVFANVSARGFDSNFDIISYAFIIVFARGFAISFGVSDAAFIDLEWGSPSTSSITHSPTFWSGGIAISIFDFAFDINWSGGIPIYDFCDINHAYVIYFKQAKEFLTSTS